MRSLTVKKTDFWPGEVTRMFHKDSMEEGSTCSHESKKMEVCYEYNCKTW